MSTIFADKFKNTSGGNPVQINQLRGIDTAGSIAVQGEGTATTNMQQGLVKSWLNFNGAGTIAARDSFNHSSLTDVSQGNYTVTMASAMGNTNYSFNSGCAGSGTGGVRSVMFGLNYDSGNLDPNFTTTSHSINTLYPNSGGAEYDVEFIGIQICGDLA